MKTAALLLIACVIALSCASLADRVVPPDPQPQTIYLGPLLLPSTRICIHYELSYGSQTYACVSLQEIRALVRGMRKT